MSSRDLCEQIFEPLKWIVPNLFPEGVTLLVSRPKLGKSWMLQQIGCGVAAGRGSLVTTDNPICGDVLYLNLEDGFRRAQRRMKKYFGASRENHPERLTIARAWRTLAEGGLEDLREWCESVSKPTLIMIDTLKKVRSPKKNGQTDYDADYGACEPLIALAHEFPGLGIMVACHDRKMDAADVFDTVSGTLGLTGGVDAIAILKRSSQGVTLHIQGRDLLDDVEKAVRFDRETCRWVLLGDAVEVHRSEQRVAVLAVLRNGPSDGLKVKEIMEMADIGTRAAADKLVQRMAERGEIERTVRGKYVLPGCGVSKSDTPLCLRTPPLSEGAGQKYFGHLPV
jgi:hypothetical protein